MNPEEALRDAETLAEDLSKHGILLISDQPILGQLIPKQPVSEHVVAKPSALVQEYRQR